MSDQHSYSTGNSVWTEKNAFIVMDSTSESVKVILTAVKEFLQRYCIRGAYLSVSEIDSLYFIWRINAQLAIYRLSRELRVTKNFLRRFERPVSITRLPPSRRHLQTASTSLRSPFGLATWKVFAVLSCSPSDEEIRESRASIRQPLWSGAG